MSARQYVNVKAAFGPWEEIERGSLVHAYIDEILVRCYGRGVRMPRWCRDIAVLMM